MIIGHRYSVFRFMVIRNGFLLSISSEFYESLTRLQVVKDDSYLLITYVTITFQLINSCTLTFWLSWQLDRPSNTPYSSIQLHFTQKVVNELPFLLHQNCLHTKECFLRMFTKILSRVWHNFNIYLLLAECEGLYGKLWTEFFPSLYGPSAKCAGHENKEGKNEDP